MRKALVVLSVLVVSAGTMAVSTQSRLLRLCEARSARDATVVARLGTMSQSSMCAYVAASCAGADGRIWLDKYSRTSVYFSRSDRVCR